MGALVVVGLFVMLGYRGLRTAFLSRDPFARFLLAGLTEDYAPSPNFDLASWRRRHMGRVTRNFRHLLDPAKDNPLVRYLLSAYR